MGGAGAEFGRRVCECCGRGRVGLGRVAGFGLVGGAGAESGCRVCESCGRGRVGLGGAAGLGRVVGLVDTAGLDEGTSGLASGRKEGPRN